MDLQTTFVERVIHLGLFLAVGGTLAVAAFAAVERLAGGEPRAVRGVHLAGLAGLATTLFAAERLYHALH